MASSTCNPSPVQLQLRAAALWLVLTAGGGSNLWARAGSSSSLFPQPTAVVEVTPDDFDQVILKSKRAWVVDFYAHWCGHCIRFAPTWRSVAEKHRGERRVGFAALNCAEHQHFCHSKQVRAYPTLRAFGFPEATGDKKTRGLDISRPSLGHSESSISSWIAERLPQLPSLPPGELASLAVSAGQNASALSAPGVKSDDNESSARSPTEDLRFAAPEDRLVDAEVALLVSFRQGVFLWARAAPAGAGVSASGDVVLSGGALSELHAWLDMLPVLLPSSSVARDLEELRRLVRTARASEFEGGGHLSRRDWEAALGRLTLDGLPPAAGENPDGFWRVCKTYTCGLWTLFHILTLAVGERTAATSETLAYFLTPSASRGPFPEDVLARIRGFVEHFFGCADCRTHFLENYDSCRLGRCDLARGDSVGLALWLWQVHNAVSQRVATERAEAKDKGAVVPGDVLAAAIWPTRQVCSSCWQGAGYHIRSPMSSWDGAATYAHLLATYWRPGWVPGGQDTAQFFLAAGVSGFLALAAVARLAFRWLRTPGKTERDAAKGRRRK